jgi:hypothetical protein
VKNWLIRKCHHTVEVENVTIQHKLNGISLGALFDMSQEDFKSIIIEELASLKLFPQRKAHIDRLSLCQMQIADNRGVLR